MKGKVNAITLDKSSKTGLVFESVVASCEVVNSQSVEVQCTGLVPTVAIDKVDGCQVCTATVLPSEPCLEHLQRSPIGVRPFRSVAGLASLHKGLCQHVRTPRACKLWHDGSSMAQEWPVPGCDGACACLQLYLSKESLAAAITTAKSSEVNVIVPGATPEDDFAESPIPEQFISTYVDGRWVTKPVEHSGG